jgi:hypothetical protein
MELKRKLAALKRIYALYDEFAAGLDLACRTQCAFCCTADVTLTTLEGYRIVNGPAPEEESDFVRKIRPALAAKRFQPNITTNQLAVLCAEGIDPPEENRPAEGGRCPLLADDLCPVYTERPFGCRCLVSRHDCREKGHAEIDDFVISVNTVFLQTIEHLDADGCTGNLVEVMGALSSKKNRQAYEAGALQCSEFGLIPNYPLKVLMLPPEHRPKMEPLLRSLRQIKV